jgi:PhzF family phenazine biosynthesis protein
MEIPFYQVDAFTDRVFAGNPAAVCPLDFWLDDAVLQSIAAENNLAETAFFVPEDGGYHLRWFTPACEVELCGHATLASAYVILNRLSPNVKEIRFRAIAGELRVTRDRDLYVLDFPSRKPKKTDPPRQLAEALGIEPDEVWLARDYMAVFRTESQVRNLRPNMSELAKFDMYALIVTARGDSADFVSRFFAPAQGVAEDPVTGSAHCTLTPFWAERLGKKQLRALQVSPRSGELFCEDRGDRVKIAGNAVLFAEGKIQVPDI